VAIREILIYPQRKHELRKKSEPVIKLDKKVHALIQDLKDTLNASVEGVGLASPQINRHHRVVAVRLGTEIDGEWQAGLPVVFINPRIIEAKDERKDFDGCLSFPRLYGETVRPHCLFIEGMDEDGLPFKKIFTGVNAVLVHHEIDHLDGILFIDRISNIEDLYRIEENESGEKSRVPITFA